MKTPLLIIIFALAVVLFACASPAAALTIGNGVTYTVDSDVTLPIGVGETLTIKSGGILIVNNNGVIDNDGTINNCGTIDNDGFINNCGAIDDDGAIFNFGIIYNYEGGTISHYISGVTNLSDPCPFLCLCEEVPTLTPTGLIALVGLLSAIAAVTLVRKRR